MADGDIQRHRLGLSMNYMKLPAKDNFPIYTTHQSKVSKHLTLEMYEKMYKRVTPNGVTVDKCIQPSVDFTGKITGLVAGDEESYTLFNEIFDAVLDDHHLGFSKTDKHPAPELEPSKLVNGKLDPAYVKSCRIRTGRSIRGLCLPPAISRAERREVERTLVDALAGLKGDLAGKYYPLLKMTPAEEKALIEDHFLFQKPTGHLMVNSNAVRDWPDGRGIWHNVEKTFLIWVNEEDHCRVISMQQGGDMLDTFERFCRGLQEVRNPRHNLSKTFLIWVNEEDHCRVIAMEQGGDMQGVFARFCTGLKEIEGLMKAKGREFSWNERLGYLCTCPTNIGTGLRCSVHVQLHKLSKDPRFEDIVVKLKMQKRGTAGEHTEAVDDVYDLSNAARLKQTEREFVQLVIDGVNTLIEMEKRLVAGKPIDDLIPK